jgi:LmbE family N-acetylglucosaminyl deacetylase
VVLRESALETHEELEMTRAGPASMKKNFRRLPLFSLILILAAWFGASTTATPLPIREDRGAAGFGLALRKLPTLGSVLYITAHPDDENNALLVRLGRGEGYRTALLSLTRGDGGQNEIGSELFEALGVLRSEEMAAIHRFDGAGQFYSRAFEFGFSFSVEETLEKWGREETVGDIVRVIRTFRPAVILTLYPTGAGGGQHHQASARLAAEAFGAAGDPARYPEQIEEGLRPWQPLRLFQSTGIGMGSRRQGGDVRVDLGVYDPLLGETYAEMGARARSRHRSQGMNVLPQPGPYSAAFVLAERTIDSGRIREGFFDGIDVSLGALSRLDPSLESSVALLEGYVDWAKEAFHRTDYTAAVRAVATGLDFVRRMRAATSHPEAGFLLEQKERDFLNAAEKGLFLHADALAVGIQDGMVVPGERFQVAVRFESRAEIPVELESVSLEGSDWRVTEEQRSGSTTTFTATVPEDAELSGPYWFREDPSVDRFSVSPGFTGIEPFRPPPLKAIVRFRAFGVAARVERPVQFRWYAAEFGQEMRMDLKVVPKLSVRISPSVALVPVEEPLPRTFEVSVRNHNPGPISSEVTLQVPADWTVDPPNASVSFRYENEVQTRRFQVVPPHGAREGRVRIRAVALADGKRFQSGVREISYSHIQPRIMVEPAEASLEALRVRIPGDLRVGYVMGVGDEVGIATEQLGASVTYLDREALFFQDLSVFDAIVLGVRAYLAREDLIANNQRLLEYVRRGGHLVVQYNKYEFLREQFAPYPLTISRPHDRVTMENSPVTLLAPRHPLFTRPNAITERDWEGWVQERGLYFLGEWDSRYEALLELRDLWPYNDQPKRGALVVAAYGEGTYVYTGLAFFRQLPAGVPGAYRLWANLISLGRERRGEE